jgi:hypothetical protein
MHQAYGAAEGRKMGNYFIAASQRGWGKLLSL